jgi:hypothetical protein
MKYVQQMRSFNLFASRYNKACYNMIFCAPVVDKKLAQIFAHFGLSPVVDNTDVNGKSGGSATCKAEVPRALRPG